MRMEDCWSTQRLTISNHNEGHNAAHAFQTPSSSKSFPIVLHDDGPPLLSILPALRCRRVALKYPVSAKNKQKGLRALGGFIGAVAIFVLLIASTADALREKSHGPSHESRGVTLVSQKAGNERYWKGRNTYIFSSIPTHKSLLEETSLQSGDRDDLPSQALMVLGCSRCAVPNIVGRYLQNSRVLAREILNALKSGLRAHARKALSSARTAMRRILLTVVIFPLKVTQAVLSFIASRSCKLMNAVAGQWNNMRFLASEVFAKLKPGQLQRTLAAGIGAIPQMAKKTWKRIYDAEKGLNMEFIWNVYYLHASITGFASIFALYAVNPFAGPIVLWQLLEAGAAAARVFFSYRQSKQQQNANIPAKIESRGASAEQAGAAASGASPDRQIDCMSALHRGKFFLKFFLMMLATPQYFDIMAYLLPGLGWRTGAETGLRFATDQAASVKQWLQWVPPKSMHKSFFDLWGLAKRFTGMSMKSLLSAASGFVENALFLIHVVNALYIAYASRQLISDASNIAANAVIDAEECIHGRQPQTMIDGERLKDRITPINAVGTMQFLGNSKVIATFTSLFAAFGMSGLKRIAELEPAQLELKPLDELVSLKEGRDDAFFEKLKRSNVAYAQQMQKQEKAKNDIQEAEKAYESSAQMFSAAGDEIAVPDESLEVSMSTNLVACLGCTAQSMSDIFPSAGDSLSIASGSFTL